MWGTCYIYTYKSIACSRGRAKEEYDKIPTLKESLVVKTKEAGRNKKQVSPRHISAISPL